LKPLCKKTGKKEEEKATEVSGQNSSEKARDNRKKRWR
jgi:hypothetical protein